MTKLLIANAAIQLLLSAGHYYMTDSYPSHYIACDVLGIGMVVASYVMDERTTKCPKCGDETSRRDDFYCSCAHESQ